MHMRVINAQFDSKIIYATPGSGKSYLCATLGGQLIDGDEVILKVMKDVEPRFEIDTRCHPFVNIRKFIRYAREKYGIVYKQTKARLLQLRDEGYTVLIGSVRLMHLADIIFTQTNPALLEVRGKYVQQKEALKIEGLKRQLHFRQVQVKKIDSYLEHYITESF